MSDIGVQRECRFLFTSVSDWLPPVASARFFGHEISDNRPIAAHRARQRMQTHSRRAAARAGERPNSGAASARAAHLRPASPPDPHVERLKRRKCSTRVLHRHSASITKPRSCRSSGRQNWIRQPRCRMGVGVGAGFQLQPRHRRPAREAGIRRSRQSAVARGGQHPDASGRTSRHSRCGIRRSQSRSRGPGARYSEAMGDLFTPLSGRSRRRGLYAESLMNLTPWKLWSTDGSPRREHRRKSWASSNRSFSGIRITLARTILHSCRRGIALPARAMPSATRLAALRRPAICSTCRPMSMPARATMPPRGGERGRRRGRSPLSRNAPPNGMYGIMYYPHNLHFLADSHMMQGRFADAQQAARSRRRAVESARRDDADGRVDGRHAGLCAACGSRSTRRCSRCNRRPRSARSARVASLRARPALAKTGKADEAAAERSCSTTAIAAVPETAAFGGGGWATAATRSASPRRRSMRASPLARGEHDRAIKFGSRQSRRPINFPTTSRRMVLSCPRVAGRGAAGRGTRG